MTWLYKPTPDNRARFLLGEPGKRNLVCIGINPSTAEPDNLDPTLKAVKRFSIALGYDGWMMLNVYPQRATNPNDLHTELNRSYHTENLQHIQDFLLTGKHDIWAAWGTLITKRHYLQNCLSEIAEIVCTSGASWYTIGRKSKYGHPHHPLYLKKDLKPERFTINEYL